MWQAIAKSVFGSANERYVKSLDKIVARINALETQLADFSDAELQAQRPVLRLDPVEVDDLIGFERTDIAGLADVANDALDAAPSLPSNAATCGHDVGRHSTAQPKPLSAITVWPKDGSGDLPS